MKIFLAGASGVIGRSLVPRLAGAGHDVTGMTGDAATTGLVRSLGARPVVVDVFDRDRLAEVIRAAHPDAIIDQLTSLRHGDYPATNRLRTEGARNLIDAALSAGVQTVVAQSYCIYAAAIGAGVPPRKQPGTGSGLRGAANSKARKDYGWEPIHPSWREGFRTALG